MLTDADKALLFLLPQGEKAGRTSSSYGKRGEAECDHGIHAVTVVMDAAVQEKHPSPIASFGRGGAGMDPRVCAALRYGFGRSLFEKPNRWLSVRYANHSSPLRSLLRPRMTKGRGAPYLLHLWGPKDGRAGCLDWFSDPRERGVRSKFGAASRIAFCIIK